MSKKNQVIGYLPDERPPFFKLLLYAIQQVIVMFPATVTVALLTGFHISTTIFASGLATLCFLLITGKKLPLYYGSSFSYLAAIGSLMASEALVGASLDEKIAVAQFGIIMSGFVSIAAGLIVNRFGKNAVEKALTDAKAINPATVKPLLAAFLEKAVLDDDGTIRGLADEIGKLAKTEGTSFLFKADDAATQTTSISGASPAGSTSVNPTTKAGTYETRLADARKAGNSALAVAIKREAAADGVELY